jgi:hypothetical protein
LGEDGVAVSVGIPRCGRLRSHHLGARHEPGSAVRADNLHRVKVRLGTLTDALVGAVRVDGTARSADDQTALPVRLPHRGLPVVADVDAGLEPALEARSSGVDQVPVDVLPVRLGAICQQFRNLLSAVEGDVRVDCLLGDALRPRESDQPTAATSRSAGTHRSTISRRSARARSRTRHTLSAEQQRVLAFLRETGEFHPLLAFLGLSERFLQLGVQQALAGLALIRSGEVLHGKPGTLAESAVHHAHTEQAESLRLLGRAEEVVQKSCHVTTSPFDDREKRP